jgi:hypothetical protein
MASLKHEELSWLEIENIWEKTTGYRLQQMKTNHLSTEIQNTWPQYTQPLGYKLVSKNGCYNYLLI